MRNKQFTHTQFNLLRCLSVNPVKVVNPVKTVNPVKAVNPVKTVNTVNPDLCPLNFLKKSKGLFLAPKCNCHKCALKAKRAC